jgi:hypothetical protein
MQVSKWGNSLAVRLTSHLISNPTAKRSMREGMNDKPFIDTNVIRYAFLRSMD